MIPGMGNQLKKLREARGMTQETAAEGMGISRSQYIKLERGDRRLTEQYIVAAAEAFGVTPAEVIADDALESALGPPMSRSGQQPRFAGYVRAGLFETFDPDFQQDYVAVPDFVQTQPGYGKIRQYAYQAKGDSMNQVGIDDGMWIVAADANDFIDQNGDLETGDIVVVERTRMQRAEREMTLKELHFFRDRYELRPRSTNPEHQPIVVRHDHNVDADGVEVKIVGILLTAYRDYRRKRR